MVNTKSKSSASKAKDSELKIILGCSGLHPEEYQRGESLPELSEIDLISYSSWRVKDRRALSMRIASGHQVIGSCSSAWLVRGSFSDQKLILEELCSELQMTQLIVRVQVRHLHQDWPSDLPFEVYLDYPKSHRDTLFLPQKGRSHLRWVWDPLWDPQPSPPQGTPCLVKIHGWHDLRWVRRYSLEQMHHAMRRVRAYAYPQAQNLPVLLSYSQRREQWAQFKAALER